MVINFKQHYRYTNLQSVNILFYIIMKYNITSFFLHFILIIINHIIHNDFIFKILLKNKNYISQLLLSLLLYPLPYTLSNLPNNNQIWNNSNSILMSPLYLLYIINDITINYHFLINAKSAISQYHLFFVCFYKYKYRKFDGFLFKNNIANIYL